VVNNISLEIADGGARSSSWVPRGAARARCWRMIAGLTGVDAGRVLLHGPRTSPRCRRGGREVGFVFQHYALFPPA